MITLDKEDAEVLLSLQAGDTVLRRHAYGWSSPRWKELKVTRVTSTMLMVGTSLSESRYRKANGRRVAASDPWIDCVFPDTPKFRDYMVVDEASYQREQRIVEARHILTRRVSWVSVPLEVLDVAVDLLRPYLRSQTDG